MTAADFWIWVLLGGYIIARRRLHLRHQDQKRSRRPSYHNGD